MSDGVYNQSWEVLIEVYRKKILKSDELVIASEVAFYLVWLPNYRLWKIATSTLDCRESLPEIKNEIRALSMPLLAENEASYNNAVKRIEVKEESAADYFYSDVV